MDSGNKTVNKNKPIIGITIGDINGIGPEIIIKALSDSRLINYITPVIFGSTKVLSFYRKMYDFEDFQYSQIRAADAINHRRVNVVNCWNELVEINVGQIAHEAGKCAFIALEKAMEYLKNDQIDALVTAPIHKKNIQNPDFNFVGHTEYVTEKLGAKESIMLMVANEIRIGLVSAHVSLKNVIQEITEERITTKLKLLEKSLKEDFQIEKPKIAVLALNPHAGEEGLLGEEEEKIIEPVINEFKRKGKLVFGPFPADGFFGTLQHQKYDATLAMYHDQGLIPFKLLYFENGVNYTAGLSKVRTSPDHGTGFNIAGKNIADPTSMREAIYLASKIVKHKRTGQASISV